MQYTIKTVPSDDTQALEDLLNNMSADDYITSQVDPCIRRYEDLFRKYQLIRW